MRRFHLIALCIGVDVTAGLNGVSRQRDETDSHSVPAALLYMKWDGGDELFVATASGNWRQSDTRGGDVTLWCEVRQTGQYIELRAVNDTDYQTRLYFTGEQRIKQPGQNEFIPHRVGRWIE